MTQDVPPQPVGPRSPSRSPSKSASMNSTYSNAHLASSGPSGSPTKPSKAKPLGPRSPPSRSNSELATPLPPLSQNVDRDDRDRPGSSRTSVYTSSKTPKAQASILGMDIHDAPTQDAKLIDDTETDTPHAPYRPPEAVIEPEEEHPPGYVPGVVEGYMEDDDFIMPVSPLRNVHDLPDTAGISHWQSSVRGYPDDRMDLDEGPSRMERPQIGPGVLPRRWLQLVHGHELIQPHITELPQPPAKKPQPPPSEDPTTQTPTDIPTSPLTATKPAIEPSLPDYERICTQADVWDACPGGEEGYGDWYFCGTCWGWIRIVARHGDLPEVDDMEQWEAIIQSGISEGLTYPGITSVDDIPAARSKRHAEYARLKDLKSAIPFADPTEHHLHEFQTLLYPTREKRLDRIPNDHVDDNAFPHLEMASLIDPAWESFDVPTQPSRLFVSCSSDWWIQVDDLIPGQLPKALALAFSSEKCANPGPGIEGKQSVADAWNMLILLLSNALFKGQRGWIKLDNRRFQQCLGMSEAISVMLYHVGFGCRQETEHLRVGPYSKGEHITASDVQQMDRYMMRVWLEMQAFLTSYCHRQGTFTSGMSCVTVKTLEDSLPEINIKAYPKMLNGYPAAARESCHLLGVSYQDVSGTVDKAYDLQISCDSRNTSKYLGALQIISDQQVTGKESLQMKLVVERSLGKYTSDDVAAAYNAIGYNNEYAELISVSAEEAPDSHIYDLHKAATQKAYSLADRGVLSRALALIGQARGSDEMRLMGERGQTVMSVDDAYNALGAPRDAVDDGLIMQYEMAVGDFPGKKDHYRTCLSIIASAQGEERPGIKTFLETGAMVVAPPPRQDIPVGLQNIGNTCYLNSILQYLYSITPLRDAVMNFEQDPLDFMPRKAEAERSRRFVRQLRLLFLQLYKSEQSAVRPDEELAYLAITRPEVDAIVGPTTTASAFPTLDSIPDIPSPSSTRVATPTPSRPYTPDIVDVPWNQSMDDSDPFAEHTRTILGKRQSQDRDSFSDTSPAERARRKSEGPDLISVDHDAISEGYEMVRSSSPSTAPDLADLSLVPVDERIGDQSTVTPFPPPPPAPTVDDPPPPADEDVVMYDAPSVPPPLPARPGRRDSTLASGLRFGLQQDSAEVLINVLSQLELAFDPGAAEGEAPAQNLISGLFSCKYKQQMFFKSAEGNSEGQAPVESVFVHPIIGVEEEGKDLYDCLGELYLKGSEIEYEGKKGYIMDLMDQFPPMLYIQMRRSQYDIATGRERKTNTHIPFGQTLQMDRFLATANPEKRDASILLTRTMTDTRSRLHQLRDRKPLSMPSTFKHVREALQQIQDMPELDMAPDFFTALENEEKRVSEEIERLQVGLRETKAKLDEVWKEEREMEYELVAVFMHRGKTSGAGHYWTYQAHLPDHPEKFFKYNDETVTEVPSSEVLQDRTGDDANPALLCYVRKGQSLVDTLHRQVLDRPKELEDEGPVVDDAAAETSVTLI